MDKNRIHYVIIKTLIIMDNLREKGLVETNIRIDRDALQTEIDTIEVAGEPEITDDELKRAVRFLCSPEASKAMSGKSDEEGGATAAVLQLSNDGEELTSREDGREEFFRRYGEQSEQPGEPK